MEKNNIKRYVIVKNDVVLGEVDKPTDIYKLIGSTKQNYYQRLQHIIFNDSFNFKNNVYKVIDKLNDFKNENNLNFSEN